MVMVPAPSPPRLYTTTCQICATSNCDNARHTSNRPKPAPLSKVGISASLIKSLSCQPQVTHPLHHHCHHLHYACPPRHNQSFNHVRQDLFPTLQRLLQKTAAATVLLQLMAALLLFCCGAERGGREPSRPTRRRPAGAGLWRTQHTIGHRKSSCPFYLVEGTVVSAPGDFATSCGPPTSLYVTTSYCNVSLSSVWVSAYLEFAQQRAR